MTSAFPKFGRSACAITLLCFIFAITPGSFALTFTHMHQAFWCCVVDATVQWPIDVVTYFSKRHLAPRTHQLLVPIINFLWSEVLFGHVARWVQLFIVHASLSPFLSDAPVSLEPSRPVTYGGMLQAGAYLCIMLIVHEVTGVLELLQAEVKEAADDIRKRVTDHDDLPPDIPTGELDVLERLPFAFFHRDQ